MKILIHFHHSFQQNITFQGSKNNYKFKKRLLQDGVMAKDVRFWPETFHKSPCMRVEIFGKEAGPGNIITTNVVHVV